jgi:hypothetical protein
MDVKADFHNLNLRAAEFQNITHSLALCAWKEARSDGIAGCEAVMNVIINRSIAWRKPIDEIIYGRNQFTSMSVASDPEFNLDPTKAKSIKDKSLWLDCLRIAHDYMSDHISLKADNTFGSLYYCHPKWITPNGWFKRKIIDNPKEHPKKATIGAMDYYG